MQNFFGVKVDTANMTLEELKSSQNKLREEISNTKDKDSLYKLREILGNVNHQISMRILWSHRYPKES